MAGGDSIKRAGDEERREGHEHGEAHQEGERLGVLILIRQWNGRWTGSISQCAAGDTNPNPATVAQSERTSADAVELQAAAGLRVRFGAPPGAAAPEGAKPVDALDRLAEFGCN